MINSINNFNSLGLGVDLKTKLNDNSFSDIFKSALNKINDSQVAASNSIASFIKGDESEIHNVMISMEEAKLTMQLAIEVRNKLVEAYQEISRTQI